MSLHKKFANQDLWLSVFNFLLAFSLKQSGQSIPVISKFAKQANT